VDELFKGTDEWARQLTLELPERWRRLGEPCAPELLDEALDALGMLRERIGPGVLVHGDLQHFNVLAAQREPWLAVDPWPYVGDREFDIGPFLRNPYGELLDWPDPVNTVRLRARRLSERLGLDPSRVRAWAVVQAVDNGLWSLGNGKVSDADYDFGCARLATQLPR
jgi:streptomycin 6-kinase